jgi:hypothetical protein
MSRGHLVLFFILLQTGICAVLDSCSGNSPDDIALRNFQATQAASLATDIPDETPTPFPTATSAPVVQQIVVLDPLDPTTNPDANACYEGGSLEGRCDNNDLNGDGTVSDDEKAWMWNYGWHKIRFEKNILDPKDYPQFGEKPAQQPQSTPTSNASICHDNTLDTSKTDVTYSGGSLQYWMTTNGTCGGSPLGKADAVVANDGTQALAACQLINASYTDAFFLADIGYYTLPNIYECQ